ncbi:hypothetical protein [Methylomicrobium sp. Wu6]|uniref:hypothetical protein n=1 Tax=Methylomicrobium sp. Wu6 TaxID=3107928 RepID=UPI002DD6433F|nr:hypothetical protein [Methylomicrobium sp. Wu6]
MQLLFSLLQAIGSTAAAIGLGFSVSHCRSTAMRLTNHQIAFVYDSAETGFICITGVN